jgi:NifU-like protein involved in Fe-S cluster formation
MAQYSDKVRKHFFSPHNVGPLAGATHVGTEGSAGQGNYVVIHLRVEEDTISEAAFQTYGCVGAISSACELTDMVAGKTVADALSIEPQDVLDSLGGLPLGKEHCAGLAVSALRKALRGGSG